MKFLLTSLLLVSCYLSAYAQRIEYANFLQRDTSIRWAAVYNSIVDVTPANPNFDINKFYWRKLHAGRVKTYQEEPGFFAVNSSLQNFESYTRNIKKVDLSETELNWNTDYGLFPNDPSKELFFRDSSVCDTCYWFNRFSFLKIKQLLLYKDHHFYIKNILARPFFYTKQTQQDKDEASYYEGDAVAFDAVLNTNTAVPASATFIARVSSRLNFWDITKNIINRKKDGLGRALFYDVQQEKIRAYDPVTSSLPDNIFINKDSLYQYKSLPVEVPVFDSTGEFVETKLMYNEMNLDSTYMFTLNQDIYFDFKTEKLYSKFVSLVSRNRVITPNGIDIGFTDFMGYDFRPFSGKKKKILKKK